MLGGEKVVAHVGLFHQCKILPTEKNFKKHTTMKSCSIIGISFISESLVCPEMPLLTDQYSIVVLRKFEETPETLLFLISKPVLCQTHIILKTQRPYSGR